MKTIKSLKDITTLEVGDKVIFGDLEYEVRHADGYFLYGLGSNKSNNKIFTILGLSTIDFVKNLGIETLPVRWIFPEVKSLEALTAIVSALLKEYEKQNELPKTWKEFCKRNPVKEGEYVIDMFSHILGTEEETPRNADEDRNFCISKQEAESHLAFMQLRQLRKVYVKGWEPDYKQQYYGIIFNANGLDILPYTLVHKSMSFPTRELAKQFLNNFKDLLEIAKPLL